MVDDHIVHDVLHISLKLINCSVLLCLRLAENLVQIDMSLEEEFCPPLLLPEACKGLPVRSVDLSALTYGGLPVAGQVGILGRRWGCPAQDRLWHLLFQAHSCQIQQQVQIAPLSLVILGRNGLKRPTELTQKPVEVNEVRLEARLVVDPVAISA